MQLKKFFAVLPALALSTALVAAQEPQPAPTNQSTQTTVGQPTDTNEPVFKGCISGTKDNYVLTTSDGKSFRLHSDKDIAEHVGKMVELRGTVKKEGADRPADAMPASSTSEMDVADVKNIEGTCPTTGAANEAPKADATNQAAVTKTEEQKATVTETPAASAEMKAQTTTQPASGEIKAETTTTTTTTTQPAATAAVSTKDESASVSANNATDQTATASAGTDQKAASDSARLPETASALPLLGLLGFASTGVGLLMRRK